MPGADAKHAALQALQLATASGEVEPSNKVIQDMMLPSFQLA
jgi:hypothetical protein